MTDGWGEDAPESQSSALNYVLNAQQLRAGAIQMPSIFLESLVLSLIWLQPLLAFVRWDLFPVWLSGFGAGPGSWE